MSEKIPKGWKWVKLGEIAEIKTGKTNSQDADNTGDYPLFDRSSIIKRSKKFLFNTEAVIVPGEGKEFIPRYYNGKFDLHQRAYAIFNFKRCIPKFIYYNVLLNKDIFKSFATGSTVLSLRLEHFLNFPILLPPLPEQKAIAEVLSSIDDKIDLLHRQNKTLEEMAMTLFRQWFIEPTKDGLPEGWEEVKIGDVLDVVLGGTPSTKVAEYWNGDIPWINSGEINNFRIIKATKYITASGLRNSNTKLMPKGTTVLAITGATLGKVSLLEIDTCANQSVVGIVPNDIFPKEYIYLWIKYKIDEIILNETGGAQPHINQNDVRNTVIIKPIKEYLNERNKKLKNIFSKITNNVFQIRTLEKLRDTLLPKLMSGEVRVKMEIM
ncbi:MAG: restriction endonuclease subunit S [Ignavibacteria bacterium]|nr:restriction endonuclease subunit S [Ignavibacteria bacterium]